jgi:hypothetical protein
MLLCVLLLQVHFWLSTERIKKLQSPSLDFYVKYSKRVNLVTCTFLNLWVNSKLAKNVYETCLNVHPLLLPPTQIVSWRLNEKWSFFVCVFSTIYHFLGNINVYLTGDLNIFSPCTKLCKALKIWKFKTF